MFSVKRTRAKRAMISCIALIIAIQMIVLSTVVVMADPPDLTITLAPSTASATHQDEFTVEVAVTPRAGQAWTSIAFGVRYDTTRLEWIQYDPAGAFGPVNLGVPAGAPWTATMGQHANGQILLNIMNPAAINIPVPGVVIFRFRVRDNAPIGNATVSWSGEDLLSATNQSFVALTFANSVPSDFAVVNTFVNRVVTFNANGGDLVASGASRTVLHGQTLGSDMPGNPSRGGGYTFAGWNRAADGTGAAFTSGTAVEENKTVYAIWTPPTVQRTVTFNANGGNLVASGASRTVPHGQSLGNDMPDNPARGGGYTFASWNTAADGTGTAFTSATAVEASKTVYAIWTPPAAQHTVTFNANGGTLAANGASRTVPHGQSLGNDMPDSSTRGGGYVFASWNTVADGTGTAFTSVTIVEASKTVYAIWISPADQRTVTFIPNGGTLATNGESRIVAVGQSLGANMPGNPTRGGGYTFAGWNTAATGAGTAFTSTTVVQANMTVYARWNPPGDGGNGGNQQPPPSGGSTPPPPPTPRPPTQQPSVQPDAPVYDEEPPADEVPDIVYDDLPLAIVIPPPPPPLQPPIIPIPDPEADEVFLTVVYDDNDDDEPYVEVVVADVTDVADAAEVTRRVNPQTDSSSIINILTPVILVLAGILLSFGVFFARRKKKSEA